MGAGESEVRGFLDSADTRSTLVAVAALGARVTGEAAGEEGLRLRIAGVGLRGPAPASIDVGNAGTLMRLLPGWLAGQESGGWTLDGDESIRRRPVDRVADPLRLMGARVRCRDHRLPPLEVEGSSLRGVSYEMPVASAQVKACLIFAGLLAEGETRLREPEPTRDHSERMLVAAGADVSREGDEVVVRPASMIEPGAIEVPGDLSSAAFLIAAALLVPGSDVTLTGVGVNPTRTGLLTILERMGADLEFMAEEGKGGEPLGSIRARHSALTATEVGGAEIPLAIDELPLIALAACFADGTTVIRDATELRAKESDRIETVAAALRALGAGVETTPDGMAISGTGGLRGGAIESHGDHRIAMLGAVAGLASSGGVSVDGMDAAAVSYPAFGADLRALTS